MFNAFEHYLRIRRQLPAEWATQIVRNGDVFVIRRCLGIGRFSNIGVARTFDGAVKCLDAFITGWAIGSGNRD